MPDEEPRHKGRGVESPQQLQKRPGEYLRKHSGMSPMNWEIFLKLPSLLTRSEWEEMTGFSEWQDPRSR